MSAFGGKADMTRTGRHVCKWPSADIQRQVSRRDQRLMGDWL